LPTSKKTCVILVRMANLSVDCADQIVKPLATRRRAIANSKSDQEKAGIGSEGMES